MKVADYYGRQSKWKSNQTGVEHMVTTLSYHFGFHRDTAMQGPASEESYAVLLPQGLTLLLYIAGLRSN